MTQPKIYGFAPSTYTQTALMAAVEAGVQVELSPLEFKKASHLALHPYGKMPALEHDGVRLFETLAIVTYLDRQFGDSKLVPKDNVGQARMLQWTSAAIDYAYEDLVNGLHQEPPSAQAVAAACEQLKLIDGALSEHQYLAGDQLTLADLFLFPMVEFCARKLDVSLFAELTSLMRWRNAMAKRPSAKQVS